MPIKSKHFFLCLYKNWMHSDLVLQFIQRNVQQWLQLFMPDNHQTTPINPKQKLTTVARQSRRIIVNNIKEHSGPSQCLINQFNNTIIYNLNSSKHSRIRITSTLSSTVISQWWILHQILIFSYIVIYLFLKLLRMC